MGSLARSLYVLLWLRHIAAFAPSTFSSRSTTVLNESASARREFIASAFTATVGPMIFSSPAFANEDAFDDLAMPSEEELKKQAEDDMAARLKRKAELQKKSSQPMKYDESMKSERAKQASLKKSKEEREVRDLNIGVSIAHLARTSDGERSC